METYKQAIRRKAIEYCGQLKKEKINFEQDKYWVEYITLGDGHNRIMCTAESAVEKLEEAKEYIKDGYEEDLTEALQILCEEEMPKIEVCNNNEWLRVYGGYEPEEDTGNDEIDEQSWIVDKRNFEIAFEDIAEFVAPKGQRIMCHGWNGAGYTHRNGGHATFDVLTEEGEKLFDSI